MGKVNARLEQYTKLNLYTRLNRRIISLSKYHLNQSGWRERVGQYVHSSLERAEDAHQPTSSSTTTTTFDITNKHSLTNRLCCHCSADIWDSVGLHC